MADAADAAQVADELVQMRREVECPVCMAQYTDPRCLACLHTICLECLRQMGDGREQKRARTVQWRRHACLTEGGGDPVPACPVPPPLSSCRVDHNTTIVCPICRNLTTLGGEGVDGLLKNFYLEKLVDVIAIVEAQGHRARVDAALAMSGQQGDPVEVVPVKCTECEEPSATSKCITCGGLLCDLCVDHHGRSRHTRSHEVKRFADMGMDELKTGSALMICPRHEDLELSLYCKTCDTTICMMCAALKHKTHDSCEIADVGSEHHTAVIRRARDAVTALIPQLEAAVVGVQGVIDLVGPTRDGVQEQIRQESRRIIAAVEARTEELLAKAARSATTKTADLEGQKSMMGQLLRGFNGGVVFCDSVLEGATVAEMLSAKAQLLARLTAVRAQFATLATDPVTDGVIEFHSTADEALPGLLTTLTVSDTVRLARLSAIITTETSRRQSDALAQWVGEALGKGPKDVRFELLFRATQDGWTARDFHRCCDNRGKTVVLCRTADGTRVFGGFAAVAWTSKDGWLGSSEVPVRDSFLFSLKAADGAAPPQQFRLNTPGDPRSIYCYPTCGPIFGRGNDLCISENANTGTGSYSAEGSYSAHTIRMVGTRYFQLSEYEVFLVR